MSLEAVDAIGREARAMPQPDNSAVGVFVDMQSWPAATVPTAVPTVPEIMAVRPGALSNLQVLTGQFADGLQHGFYAADIDRLMQRLVQSQDPASGVGFGEVTVELLNVQAKVGIADAFAKLSTKLSEGLQTLVVRQG